MKTNQVKSIKDLDQTLLQWFDKQQNRPQICNSFYNALYHLVTYVDISLNGLSEKSRNNYKSVEEANKKIKDKEHISIFTIFSGIVSSHIIPELYSFSLVGGWGLLEEFLIDVPYYIISNKISSKIPPEYLKIKKIEFDNEKLTLQLLEKAKNNLPELVKIYKNLLNIDLKKNDDFIELMKLRQKRHRIAHTGMLLGYNSLTRDLFWDDKKFQDELWSISRRAGEEFTDVKTTYNEKGHPVLHITEHPYDPIDAKTSKELEEDFCLTIIHMWKLCDSLFEGLFYETEHP